MLTSHHYYKTPFLISATLLQIMRSFLVEKKQGNPDLCIMFYEKNMTIRYPITSREQVKELMDGLKKFISLVQNNEDGSVQIPGNIIDEMIFTAKTEFTSGTIYLTFPNVRLHYYYNKERPEEFEELLKHLENSIV
jgi:hypothetical protein